MLDPYLDVPLHSNYVKSHDGEQIYYATNFDPRQSRLANHKPCLLFNYGLVCSNWHWLYQLKWFHERGYPFIIHDYRAHFQSTGEKNIEAVTFQNICHDINQILIKAQVEKVIAIGHSMGVNVTLELAALYPEKILSMVLISGTVLPVKGVMFDNNLMEFIIPLSEWIQRYYQPVIETVWKNAGINPLTLKLIHSQGFNQKRVPLSYIEVYMNRLAQLGAPLFFQLLDQMSNHDILARLSQLDCPSLVLGGDQDRVIPFYLQRLLQSRLPLSELYFIKDGSHVPQADFPELVNERVFSFLENYSKTTLSRA
jgi:non-heme chloroperoxidase